MARLAPAILLALTLLVSTAASATTVLQITLEQMTLASHTIAHGVVKSSRAETINGNARHIRTVVEVEVRELIKGQKGTKTLTLIFPGGRVGEWAMQIPGMPKFTAGEEVVLFLEKTSVNWALTGLSQGKFTVTANTAGQKIVSRRLAGMHMVRRDAQGQLKPVHALEKPTEQTLKGLLTEVKHYLQKSAEAAK